MSASTFSPAAIDYLAAREIDPQLAATLGVRERRGSLRFPCRAADGSSYERERILNGVGPAKVKQPARQPLTLWWPLGRPARADAVLVTEGESDALAALEPLSESRFAALETVAVPGTGFPAERLAADLVACGACHVYLTLDGDDAGRKFAERAATALREAGIRPVVVEMPDGTDLAAMLAAVDDRVRWLNGALADAEAATEPAEASGLRDVSRGGSSVPIRDFIATPRPPLDPYLETLDQRSVLLARETMLLFAGPSGLGKSLAAAFDLAGRLADDEDSDWLGFRVSGRRRVLLLSLEGSDEDTAERADALVPRSAEARFRIWDRWRGGAAPRADEEGLRRLAAAIAQHEIDVLVLDTASAFFASAYDCSKGLPEEAFAAIQRLRELAGRPIAVIVVAHTKKADRSGAKIDELEEIAGTFARKADAAIVMRRHGKDAQERRLVFAKTRTGPEPLPKIAAFPDEDSDAPPRLRVTQDLQASGVKAGTSADEMAAWIKEQPAAVAPGSLCKHFGIGESTLRERRAALDALGISYRPRAGYGAPEQWRGRGSAASA